MREFHCHAAEIIPNAGEDVIDFGRGFFREGGAQIIAAEAVFLPQRPELARERSDEIRRLLAVGPGQGAHDADREVADAASEKLEPPLDHQKVTMILPNTCRLSSRARPRSKSASGTSVSITGVKAGRHLGEALADVAHRSAERTDDAILLQIKLEQIDRRRLARRSSRR